MSVGNPPSERKPLVLFVGAHADDVELGCGATMHRYRQKWDCVSVFVTRSPSEWNIDDSGWRRRQPGEWAIPIHQELGSRGAGEDANSILPFWEEAKRRDVSSLHQRATDVRYKLTQLKKVYHPALVFLIDRDRHPDHQLVYDIGKYLFDDVIVYRPHRLEPFEPNFYIPIDQKNLDAKVKVVNIYRDLYVKASRDEGPYFSEEVIRAAAVMDAYPVRRYPSGPYGNTMAEAFRVDKLSPAAAGIF